jgi:uncharacterized membrane protein
MANDAKVSALPSRRGPMAFISRTFLRGLVTVLPIALTLYVIWWVGSTAQELIGALVERFYPGAESIPGAGLLLGFVLVFALGLVMRAWIGRWLFALGEGVLQRIPFVRTIYGPLKDLAGFFGEGEQKQGFSEVVMVDLGAAQMMGFVTGTRMTQLGGGGDQASVYLPMSYQLGGFVVVVPRSRVRPLGISVQDGLRLVLTAGVGH